jgi:hypothetical protein
LYMNPYITILSIIIIGTLCMYVCMHSITVISLYRNVLINLKYLCINLKISLKI